MGKKGASDFLSHPIVLFKNPFFNNSKKKKKKNETYKETTKYGPYTGKRKQSIKSVPEEAYT